MHFPRTLHGTRITIIINNIFFCSPSWFISHRGRTRRLHFATESENDKPCVWRLLPFSSLYRWREKDEGKWCCAPVLGLWSRGLSPWKGGAGVSEYIALVSLNISRQDALLFLDRVPLFLEDSACCCTGSHSRPNRMPTIRPWARQACW